MDAAASPLPREERTPPVTNMNFVFMMLLETYSQYPSAGIPGEARVMFIPRPIIRPTPDSP